MQQVLRISELLDFKFKILHGNKNVSLHNEFQLSWLNNTLKNNNGALWCDDHKFGLLMVFVTCRQIVGMPACMENIALLHIFLEPVTCARDFWPHSFYSWERESARCPKMRDRRITRTLSKLVLRVAAPSTGKSKKNTTLTHLNSGIR